MPIPKKRRQRKVFWLLFWRQTNLRQS
ncbi:unnamed protein product [Timema podura]|uniref:Ribosomal protein L32 n=1 Tax=Timema podura TaxID=61482 RepID=A0ABN7NHE1_TIMPD|nr:unnamed protein product [Timema podura]